MALNVTRARVKEKCGIAATTYDSTIDSLIAEFVPAIQFAIRPEHIADTGNTGLQATLNLGAVEIVAAEFLDQLAREPGAFETVTVGDLTLAPSDRPARLLQSAGWRRLGPYLKLDPSEVTAPGVSVAANKPSTPEANL